MQTFIKGALIVAAFLLSASAASAAVNLTHLTVDGKTNTTVQEGDVVDARVTFNITASTDAESFSWELIGSGLPQQCPQDIDDHITDGTFTATFPIDTTGASEGTWDVLIRVYGDNGPDVSNLCETTDQVDSMTFSDRITVSDDVDDNQGGNNTGGEDDEDAMPSWLAALLAKLFPPTPPAPTTNAKCTAVNAKLIGTMDFTYNQANVQLQGFLLSEGMSIPALAAGASFGYKGPQTNAALAQFKAMHQCI